MMATDPPEFPAKAFVRVAIDPSERAAVEDLAERVRAADASLSSDVVSADVAPGLEGPRLLIEDRSEVALNTASGIWDYRMHLLGGDGDVSVVGCERNHEFEEYADRHLRLGRPDVVGVHPHWNPGASLADVCLSEEDTVRRLAAWARHHGRASIVPYLGNHAVWQLASAIAHHAGVPVSVAASLPHLTLLANDKLWFIQRVAELFGTDALPPSGIALGPQSLAHRAAAMIRRHGRIVVKVPNSSGSLGNVVIAEPNLRDLTPEKLRDRLVTVFQSRGWDGSYPLLLSAWEPEALRSPSVQLWIPEAGDDPVVEGIFVQTVSEVAGEFIGGATSDLPDYWNRRLAEEGLRLALFFQHLGYYGRCSFDALLVGSDLAYADIRWIECNGRWGGISLPMTVARRLTGGSVPIAVVQTRRGLSERVSFASVAERISAMLWRPGAGSTGVVLLSPTVFTAGEGLHLMAIGNSPEHAQEMAGTAAGRLAENSQ